jgi:hypothetical protein
VREGSLEARMERVGEEGVGELAPGSWGIVEGIIEE